MRRRLYLVLILTANTLLLLAIVNVGLFFLFKVYDAHYRSLNPIQRKYHDLSLNLYPGLTNDQINGLLTESWSSHQIYEPFTIFKEQPFEGTYIRVSPNGYRNTPPQGPWPPDPSHFNIFCFGGSTTFGYGNSDDHTIPSALQTLLRARNKKVSVYNFGRSGYYSSQERILFQKLLISGVRPDIAVFIDGLNDFAFLTIDKPDWTDELSRLMDPNPYKGLRALLPRMLHGLPMTRFANSLSHGFLSFRFGKAPAPAPPVPWNPSVTAGVADRYLNNKKMIEAIAGAYHIKVVFVWQPIPFYKALPEANPFIRLAQDYDQAGWARNYAFTESYFGRHEMGNDFLWDANFQQTLREPLYVDAVHYSAPMCEKLAAHVADLIERGPRR